MEGPIFFISTIEDITRAKEAELALATSNRLLDAVIENLPVMAFLKRASDLRFVRLNRAGEKLLGYPRDEFLNRTDYDFFSKERADAFKKIDHEVFAGDETQMITEELVRTRSGASRYLLMSRTALRDTDGTPTHLLGVSVDITARKEAEERARLLLCEVNHRSKNLLTVVQALARHTAIEVDPDLLAASHDLLVKSDWRGADMADLVRSQLAHLGDLVGARVTFDGPSLRLSTSAAQAIGMALHELATNAVNFGALSDDDGVVRVAWEHCADGDTPHVRIQWSEHDGPPAQEPDRQGFGHTVMVSIIEHDLGADVRRTYARSGVVWEMTAPAQKVLEEAYL